MVRPLPGEGSAPGLRIEGREPELARHAVSDQETARSATWPTLAYLQWRPNRPRSRCARIGTIGGTLRRRPPLRRTPSVRGPQWTRTAQRILCLYCTVHQVMPAMPTSSMACGTPQGHSVTGSRRRPRPRSRFPSVVLRPSISDRRVDPSLRLRSGRRALLPRPRLWGGSCCAHRPPQSPRDRLGRRPILPQPPWHQSQAPDDAADSHHRRHRRCKNSPPPPPVDQQHPRYRPPRPIPGRKRRGRSNGRAGGDRDRCGGVRVLALLASHRTRQERHPIPPQRLGGQSWHARPHPPESRECRTVGWGGVALPLRVQRRLQTGPTPTRHPAPWPVPV
mmetsp:Transcript_15430/g.39857  ORF Transcript_15430/g.39857 Transcript_15430/m.39857 type:complete len:335 (-) Transcript_15430:233-1237(-)